MCYNDKGELRRMYRNLKMECRDSVDGWHCDDVISYTSYSDKKGADTSHMSLLYQHHVHPTAFVNYFNKIAVEYIYSICQNSFVRKIARRSLREIYYLTYSLLTSTSHRTLFTLTEKALYSLTTGLLHLSQSSWLL